MGIFFVVEGRGRNRFGLGKGYHLIHILSIEKVIIDGKHDAHIALKVWVNGIGLSHQQQHDSFDTVQTSLLMIKVITSVPMFMPMRLHFIAGSDKVKSSRQKSDRHI